MTGPSGPAGTGPGGGAGTGPGRQLVLIALFVIVFILLAAGGAS